MKLAPAAQRLIGSVTLEHEDGSETTIDISRELVIKARMLGWSGFELMAEAVQAWHRSRSSRHAAAHPLRLMHAATGNARRKRRAGLTNPLISAACRRSCEVL